MPADPNRVQAVFLAAVKLADRDARTAYLDSACAGEADLRHRVEALLRAHNAPDSLLDAPFVAADATQTHGDVSVPADESLSFLAPPQRPDSLGRIGHYEVLEILGRGGFGVVFRAFDDVLQRVVAVKVLSPHLATTSPARRRFLREARAAAQVRHDNVVQVYAVVEEPLPFLVMEFIPGETLQERLDRTGPLDVREIVRIGRQIASGLAAAHSQGLIHRDIKPTNVLVDGSSELRVKITDFGLARAADDASLTRSGVVAGTPMYMAPEQARGEALDHRADLFSLGSVLYVMCSGRPPFRASGTMGVLKRVCDEEPRPIREIIPETPDWLCRIVEKLHAKKPEDRFQTAAEVADLFADCETQLAAKSDLADRSRIPTRKPAGRTWHWIWKAVLFAAVVTGGTMFVYMAMEPTIVPKAAFVFDRSEGWIPLFYRDGKTSWIDRVDKGSWHVSPDDALVAEGRGHLFTKEEYDHFHLFAEVRVGEGADGGILFRCDRNHLVAEHPVAYEAMINATNQQTPRTGSLMDPKAGYKYGMDPGVPPGEWFTYEVIADGEEITLKVNGNATLRGKYGYHEVKRGPIGLQFPGDGKKIEFKNVWIKPLRKAKAKNDVVAALRQVAASKKKTRDATEARVKAGSATKAELLVDEIEHLESMFKIADAEGDGLARVQALQELLIRREEERRLVEQRIKAKAVPGSAMNAVDAAIAEIKSRIARAKQESKAAKNEP
jgi:serine/threonine protein kinase